MIFQISQINYDFHSKVGTVSLRATPDDLAPAYGHAVPASTNVIVTFQLESDLADGKNGSATAAELKNKAKSILLAAASAL